jgi:choline dehydrogenase-like flavoprotein
LLSEITFKAFKAFPGIDSPKEGADGNAVGVFWIPNSIDPSSRTRSYSKTGHWEKTEKPGARQNFHLLPAHRVTQIMMNAPAAPDPDTWTAAGVRIMPRDGEVPAVAWEVMARKEIVISAGAVHTPQVLQRSGVGPKDVLEAAKVQVKVDLPGVGWNLHDHMNFQISFRCKWPVGSFQNFQAD